MFDTTKEDKGLILRSQTGTPTRGMELDSKVDNGVEQIKTGMVECKVCKKLFKERGIKIHLAKTKCGKMSGQSNSQRIESKSRNNQSLESGHRGEVFHEKRRKPFIVSQTFHNSDHTQSKLPDSN